MVAAATAASIVALPAMASTAPKHQRLHQRSVLAGHATLVSPNGRFHASVSPRGRLRVQRGKSVVWHSFGPHGRAAKLRLHPSGNLTLRSGSQLLWASATAGSHAKTLTLNNMGALVLRSVAGRVWSSAAGNLCRGGSQSGPRVVIDLSQQFAKVCNADDQLLTTRITSGATALGDGTPTGTWHLQGKQRDTYLYPAAGGAYYVHYWMPYDGAYGMHDSPWQTFPYGSQKYRTEGSHGCVHFPRAAIAWMFRWARIGTTVQIRP
jgi:hypothetical protein